MEKTLIFFVEDEENIRELIFCTLSAAGFKAEGFSEPDTFYEALSRYLPELILLDVMLPYENGYEILARLRSKPETARIPVIFLTAKTAELDKVRGLDGGADDYITKPFRVLEFISRINAVLRRYKLSELPERASRYMDLTIDRLSREIRRGEEIIALTYKEYELFMTLFNNIGIVLSRESLLLSVWGFDFEGETRTVDMHVTSLRRKLGDSADNPKYIATVRGHGYKLIRE